MFFSRGSVPIISEAWLRSLDTLDANLVTLDHLGYAQRPLSISFAPPHLAIHLETMPLLPKRMHILLPCPIHEPSPLLDRHGVPFRYWTVPLTISNAHRDDVRRRFLRKKKRASYLSFGAHMGVENCCNVWSTLLFFAFRNPHTLSCSFA